MSLFSKARCVAIQKAPQWTIYLDNGLTYLRILADPTSRPRRKQMMPPNHMEPEPPASPSMRQSAAILTISSWKANLAAAARCNCQRRFLPGGPCVEQTSAPSSLESAKKKKVSCRLSRDIYKVIWLAVSHTVLHVGTFSLFFFHTGFCKGTGDIWRTWAHLGCSWLPCRRCLMLSF